MIGWSKKKLNIEEVKQFALTDWTLGDTHGLPHWERVERNGLLLSCKIRDGELHIIEGVNTKVVRLFAYLHDKCRENDGADLEHGARVAEMLHTIRDTLLQDLSDDEFTMLEQACRLHTTTHKIGNPTIDVCFDSDRLDLGRVGIEPSPEKMATVQGAFYAENPHEFERIVNRIKEHYTKALEK